MRKRLLAALLALLMTCCIGLSALAEETTFVEPTLAPDATPYDAEHPELLEDEQLYAPSAIVIEQSTGLVIYEKNADEVRYPASTTKILTVLLGIQWAEANGTMEDTVLVSENAVTVPDDSTTMGLVAGEEINFHDLLVGTLLRSANEGANVIAETVSGSIPNFVQYMNEAVAAFGCTSTHFANANGLHDPDHYTTARDMAIIARAAMQNETFREIANTTSYAIAKTNKRRARTITVRDNSYRTPGTSDSPNKYYYADGTGIKTGYTSQAGYCYVGSASRDGIDLISVVLGAGKRGRWADTIKLMDYGFSQYQNVTPIDLYEMNPITIQTTNYSLSDTDMGRVSLLCKAADASNVASIIATKSEIENMANNLRVTCLISYTRDFEAPIEAGEQMGTMTYFDDNGNATEYILTAARTVAMRENAPKTLEQIVEETDADPNPFPPLTLEFVLYMAAPVLLLILLIYVLRRISKRRRVRNKRVPKPTNRYLK